MLHFSTLVQCIYLVALSVSYILCHLTLDELFLLPFMTISFYYDFEPPLNYPLLLDFMPYFFQISCPSALLSSSSLPR